MVIVSLIINKILLLVFLLSILNVIRHTYFFIQSWVTNDRYVLSNRSLLLLGLSISYFLMSIFSGISI